MSSLQQNWRKGQYRFCLEARGLREKGEGGGWGRNDPNNVYTYEYMNEEKRIKYSCVLEKEKLAVLK
jgi:hypothetical protein